jgi:hypothetical protein
LVERLCGLFGLGTGFLRLCSDLAGNLLQSIEPVA